MAKGSEKEMWKPESIVDMPIDELAIPPYGVRHHSEMQLSLLMESIRNYGFVTPVVVDSTGVVIAGSGRVQAAMRLGRKTVPVILHSELSEQQAREYAIVDNQISDMSSWDEDALDGALLKLQGMGLTLVGDIQIAAFEPSEAAMMVAEREMAKKSVSTG